MKCEECNGSGIGFDGDVQTENGPRAVQIPCEECGGTGLQHCCEGLRADPVVDGDWVDNPAKADTFGRKK